MVGNFVKGEKVGMDWEFERVLAGFLMLYLLKGGEPMLAEDLEGAIVRLSGRIIERERLIESSRYNLVIGKAALSSVEEVLKSEYEDLESLQSRLRLVNEEEAERVKGCAVIPAQVTK